MMTVEERKERKRVRQRRWRESNLELSRAMVRDCSRKSGFRSQRAWKEANPEKVAAQNDVKRALRHGKLAREACLFCNDPQVEAHHHDYDQSLVVTWLCRRHHRLAHRTIHASP